MTQRSDGPQTSGWPNSVKSGLKPEYAIRLGDGIIPAISPIKYLGVFIDYKRTYRQHVEGLTCKSASLYSRLKGLMSAEWGLSQATARVIYKSVFLPKITYAAEIWQKGLETKKAIAKLGSAQRRTLLACTGAYRTTSTSALQVIAGIPPLDLEIQGIIAKCRFKRGLIDRDEFERRQTSLTQEWEDRWNKEDKGEWTKKMVPSVMERMKLPMVVDHYASQVLSGHGDLRGKLHQFKLVDSPNCSCGNGSETVNHFLTS